MENQINGKLENANKDIKFKSEGIIALPHTGQFPWWTTMSLLGLRIPDGHSATWHMISNCLIYDAREKLVKDMYKQNKDWVLFIDSDMVVPNDMLQKMLDSNLPIVSGMAFKRIPPFQPCFYTKVDIKGDIQNNSDKIEPVLETVMEFADEGMLKVEGVGLACCLIRREVFDIIKPPYFFPFPNMGEDLTFFYKCKQMKIPVHVDLSIDVGHVADLPIQKEHYRQAYKQYKASNTDKMLFDEENK